MVVLSAAHVLWVNTKRTAAALLHAKVVLKIHTLKVLELQHVQTAQVGGDLVLVLSNARLIAVLLNQLMLVSQVLFGIQQVNDATIVKLECNVMVLNQILMMNVSFFCSNTVEDEDIISTTK